MSSDLLLCAKGISKVYSLSKRPLSTLFHALFGTKNDGTEQYLVLSDIDIEIRRGETVGIMGRNGAGKTTLLGILGNVIQPTAGTVIRSGRIATLLGLTAGFNTNFSGRENAYLFCSIQGLTRAQTDSRIEAIIAFAELGKYFDMPLQSYSSGMQSRLAFACAIHVDANLIIIDETLAVGDANFRMKCYDRIRKMKEEGQTFLLVSHNQNLVANFCTRAIVLEGGRKIFDGSTFEAVEAYKQVRTEMLVRGNYDGKLLVKGSKINSDNQDAILDNFTLIEDSFVRGARALIKAELTASRCLENVTFSFGIRNHLGIVICSWDGSRASLIIPRVLPGEVLPVEFVFYKHLLAGKYFFTCSVHELIGDIMKPVAIYQNCLSFEVVRGSDVAMNGIVDMNMSARIGIK